jgi:hypothetical protein
MKKVFLSMLFLTAGIIIAVTGCGPLKKSAKKDIEFFIRNDMGLEQFDIIGSPVKVDFGSNDDWMWTAETDAYSMPEPVIFHVYNILEYTGEHSVRVTYSDLDYVLDGIMFSAYTGWTDDLYYEDVENGPFTKGHRVMRVVRNIRERKDFYSFAQELTDLISYMRSEYPSVMDKKTLGRGHIIEYACAFVRARYSDMWLPTSDHDFIHCSEADDELKALLSTSGKSDDEIRDAFSTNGIAASYLKICLENGLVDRLEEFTIEERQAVISSDSYKLEELCIEDSSGDIRHTGYTCVFNRIPYGALYMLLEEFGIEIDGTWEKFQFTGTDGEVHTFDYEEFTDKVLDPEVKIEDLEKMAGIKIYRTEKDGRYIRVAKSSD